MVIHQSAIATAIITPESGKIQKWWHNRWHRSSDAGPL
jgi:hypothetical protein